jgi:lysophospholipase L1-like esterase
VLLRELGLAEAYNMGISGTRIARQTGVDIDTSFTKRCEEIPKDIDAIVVYGGVNDYMHGNAPFGKQGDRTPDTFVGAVWYLMNYLKTQHAGKPIIFLAPAKMDFDGAYYPYPSTRPEKLPDCLPLINYVDVIIETAREFNIPVLDLYRDLPIDASMPEYQARYAPDGLHFSDDGHKIIAKMLCELISNL